MSKKAQSQKKTNQIKKVTKKRVLPKKSMNKSL